MNDSGLHCPVCGYNLTALTASRCPECGQRFAIVKANAPGIRPSDLAAVGIALLGLWELLQGMAIVRTLIGIEAGWFRPAQTEESAYGLSLFQHVATAVCLLIIAKPFGRWIFRERVETSEAPEDATAGSKGKE